MCAEIVSENPLFAFLLDAHKTLRDGGGPQAFSFFLLQEYIRVVQRVRSAWSAKHASQVRESDARGLNRLITTHLLLPFLNAVAYQRP